jgi:hydroxylamine reductase
MADTSSDLHRLLLGELIGLARATDGNGHLITPAVTRVIVQALSAPPSSDTAELSRLRRSVEEAKRQMVPDCFHCACPCGRTDAFDLLVLDSAPEDERALRLQLLSLAQNIAAGPHREAADAFLYKALILVGMDGVQASYLQEVVRQGALLLKYSGQ